MKIIKPANDQEWLKLRVEDITSTEVGALFGISPYLTEFELWHRKKERTVYELPDNERMKWGNRLQDSIAHGIAEDKGWKVRRMNEYIRLEELRIGASFDFSIEAEDKGIGLLEIKNVDALIARDKWIAEQDNLEAPLHIELQVQHQLFVSGREFAYIGALVGGNRVILIKRVPDLAVQAAIKSTVRNFWKSIEENRPPSPDFSRDSKFIAQLYGYAEPGKIYDAKEDGEIAALMDEYKNLTDVEKNAKNQKDSIKAQILIKIGDAEKIIGDRFTISAGIIGPTMVPEHIRSAYRNFKPSFKKEKTNA